MRHPCLRKTLPPGITVDRDGIKKCPGYGKGKAFSLSVVRNRMERFDLFISKRDAG
jgi:hypothetical protein